MSSPWRGVIARSCFRVVGRGRRCLRRTDVTLVAARGVDGAPAAHGQTERHGKSPPSCCGSSARSVVRSVENEVRPIGDPARQGPRSVAVSERCAAGHHDVSRGCGPRSAPCRHKGHESATDRGPCPPGSAFCRRFGREHTCAAASAARYRGGLDAPQPLPTGSGPPPGSRPHSPCHRLPCITPPLAGSASLTERATPCELGLRRPTGAAALLVLGGLHASEMGTANVVRRRAPRIGFVARPRALGVQRGNEQPSGDEHGRG